MLDLPEVDLRLNIALSPCSARGSYPNGFSITTLEVSC